jgi:2-dehydro-3-deoxygluconokinase
MTGNVVCLGEVLLRLSAPGKELLLQSARLECHIGGAEANVAVGLSKLGHRTAMVSVLPNNGLGQAAAAELRRHGVGTESIQWRDGRMGLYFLTHGAGPRPAEVLYDRAGSAFAAAPADIFNWRDLLKGAAWLHVSGITPAVSEAGAELAFQAMIAARTAGVSISFDCNFRSRLWGDRSPAAPRLLSGLCELATLIFGEQRDIDFMLGTTGSGNDLAKRQREAADRAFAAFGNLQWLAHTDRTRTSADVQELSATIHARDRSFTTRTHPLLGIVDRIGAGDAFAAGVLHGLIEGLPLPSTADYGVAAACLKHTIPGDFNLVGPGDVDLFLSDARTDVRR